MLPVPPFSGKIAHFYADLAVGWEHCQKTFEAVLALKGKLEKYDIESVCLDGTDDYAFWKALKKIWGLADLVIIEQDIIFTEEQLLELLKCKHRNCAFAYELYPITTGLATPVWSIGENRLPDRIRLYTLEEKPQFCNFSAIGFIKLSKETQLKVSLDTPTHWKFVDLATVGKIPDIELHVHYEVEHAHRE